MKYSVQDQCNRQRRANYYMTSRHLAGQKRRRQLFFFESFYLFRRYTCGMYTLSHNKQVLGLSTRSIQRIDALEPGIGCLPTTLVSH